MDGVITYTREARCSDCHFLKQFMYGKLKRHCCTNKESARCDGYDFTSQVRLKDLACNKWKVNEK